MVIAIAVGLNLFLLQFLLRGVLRLRGWRVPLWLRRSTAGEPIPARDQLVATASAVLAAYLVAVVLFAAAMAAGGRTTPVEDLTTEVEVTPASAAADAGLQSGDRVVRISDAEVDSWTALVEAVATHPHETIEVEARRSGAPVITQVTLGDPPRLGVRASPIDVSLPEALLRSLPQPVIVVTRWVQGMWEMLSGAEDHEVATPVTVVAHAAEAQPGSTTGVLALLQSLALPIVFLILLFARHRRGVRATASSE